MKKITITANQYPHRANYLARMMRSVASLLPVIGPYPTESPRPWGISIYMRVKNERDWIETSIASIHGIADEIIIADNGSTDGTYEILQEIVNKNKGFIRLWRKPDLHHDELSNFALEQTTYRWVFRWDGDMVAHTSGDNSISKLRSRILALHPRRYYLIYLRHINLAGDLFHQDPQEMVHIEEYVHTFSRSAHFIHPNHFEAVEFPLFYQPLFWYEPYVFHVNVKPARRMLLRYFWEDWMTLKDYRRYPTLESYVMAYIEKEFGTPFIEEAQKRYLSKALKLFIPFDPEQFGPYPKLLKNLLESPKYLIQYENGQISGREDL